MSKVTVPDVIRQMGLSVEPKVSWSVGSRIAAEWREQYGSDPDIALRPKTNGGGSHHFAVYPRSWVKRIEKVVREQEHMSVGQLNMFFRAP